MKKLKNQTINPVRKYYSNGARITLTSLIAALACTGIIYAATTVGNNITTGGTLTSTGANTFYGATTIGGALTATSTLNVTGLTTLGNASTTVLSVSGNLMVGDGTPNITLDGEDAYIEGTLEVDGTVNFGQSLEFTPPAGPTKTECEAMSIVKDNSGGICDDCIKDGEHKYTVFYVDTNGYQTNSCLKENGSLNQMVSASTDETVASGEGGIDQMTISNIPQPTDSRITTIRLCRKPPTWDRDGDARTIETDTTVCANDSGDLQIVTTALHAVQVYDKVKFLDGGGTVCDPLVSGTDYWVTEVDSTTAFNVSDVQGGTNVGWATDAGTAFTSQAGQEDSTSQSGYYKVADLAVGVTSITDSLKQEGTSGNMDTACSRNSNLPQNIFNDNIGEGNYNVTSQYNRTNTITGYQSGQSITDTVHAIGNYYSRAGVMNTFYGAEAGQMNDIGELNTYVGYRAGQENTSGYYNTYIGGGAGEGLSGVETGYENTFIGAIAGSGNTTGYENTFIGAYAAKNNVEGYGNVFIGKDAGYGDATILANVGQSYNTFIGTEVGYFAFGNSGIFMGYQAGKGGQTPKASGKADTNTVGKLQDEAGGESAGDFINDSIAVGDGVVRITPVTSCTANDTPWECCTGDGTGTCTVATGWVTVVDNATTLTLNIDLFPNGDETYRVGDIFTQNNTIAIGEGAAATATGGRNNTFIGQGAGASAGGSFNDVMGFGAYINGTTGTYNVVLGTSAGRDNTTGSNNVFIGQGAGQEVTTSSNSIFIGLNAGGNHTIPKEAVIIGDSAKSVAAGGVRNTVVGYGAGKNMTGSKNVVLGYLTGDTANSGASNVLIGESADFSGGSVANSIGIGLSVLLTRDNETVLGGGILNLVDTDDTATGDAGTVVLTSATSFLVSDGGADNNEDTFSLANGKVGDIKYIVYKTNTDGADTVNVTPTTAAFTDILFNAVGEGVTLLYVDNTIGWTIVGKHPSATCTGC